MPSAKTPRAAWIVVDVVLPIEWAFDGAPAAEVVQQVDDREALAPAQGLDPLERHLGGEESGWQSEAQAPAQRLRGADLVRMRVDDHCERDAALARQTVHADEIPLGQSPRPVEVGSGAVARDGHRVQTTSHRRTCLIGRRSPQRASAGVIWSAWRRR